MPHTPLEIWKHLEVATATGGGLIVTFWALYFAANDVLDLVDPALASLEEAFLVPDALLAAVLFATSVALHRRHAAAPFLLAIAAAVSVYLGVLDASIYVRNGLYSPFTTGEVSAVAIQLTCIGGGAYGLRAAYVLWRPR